MEKLLFASPVAADSLLLKSGFKKAGKETGKGFTNYYYTSYERQDLYNHLLRSLSFMDFYNDGDTSRLVLYRTYYENDQDELKKQLLANGYELQRQAGNEAFFKKGDLSVTNRIAEKRITKGKPVTAYEFELGR